jgi:protein-tyrosine-phosphatase
MAEGFARQLGGGRIEALSAGLFPAALIQPETYLVMAERGIALDREQTPRSILELDGASIDVLVDMSGRPALRLLPRFQGRDIVWEVPDPIGLDLGVYRAVRDLIEQKVRGLLEELDLPQRYEAAKE